MVLGYNHLVRWMNLVVLKSKVHPFHHHILIATMSKSQSLLTSGSWLRIQSVPLLRLRVHIKKTKPAAETTQRIYLVARRSNQCLKAKMRNLSYHILDTKFEILITWQALVIHCIPIRILIKRREATNNILLKASSWRKNSLLMTSSN